jgi:hypothetical protein
MVSEHWTVIAPELPRHAHAERHGHEFAVEEELLDRFSELGDYAARAGAADSTGLRSA